MLPAAVVRVPLKAWMTSTKCSCSYAILVRCHVHVCGLQICVRCFTVPYTLLLYLVVVRCNVASCFKSKLHHIL